MSALIRITDPSRTSRKVRKVPILLQKSKIVGPGESRKSRFLDAPAAARLSGANTKVGGRFGMKGCGPSCRHTRNASAVFKIFVLHPKKTFATISANSRHSPPRSFDNLVGADEQRGRHGEAERFGSLHVDN